MRTTPLDRNIDGPLVIETEVFRDHRGSFAERFNKAAYQAAGLPVDFTQDNQSQSLPQVLRGLHFQLNPPQGKLIWVAAGKIFDAIVDVRHKSPSFLKTACIELDSKKPEIALWVPAGFAHGFCVVGVEPAEVIYKMTSPYNPKGESGLLWNDPDLKINWPIENPILSERDQNLLSVSEFKKECKP
jgi:dTDP-4-dehydrorhamnose 3,5-epimerase